MAKHNVWLSVSDLMTGLMVIFLFVAIAYISKVDEHTEVLAEYIEARQNLHDRFITSFHQSHRSFSNRFLGFDSCILRYIGWILAAIFWYLTDWFIKEQYQWDQDWRTHGPYTFPCTFRWSVYCKRNSFTTPFIKRIAVFSFHAYVPKIYIRTTEDAGILVYGKWSFVWKNFR